MDGWYSTKIVSCNQDVISNNDYSYNNNHKGLSYFALNFKEPLCTKSWTFWPPMLNDFLDYLNTIQ